jgi:hypothetical protein
MLKQFSIVKNAIADTKILNSIPLKDLESTLKTMTESKYESMTYIEAKNMETYLKTIASDRIEKMSTNPVKFLFNTNDEIERLTNEYNEETNNDLKTQKKLSLVEKLIETQINMGSSDSQIKVMSIQEAQSFVQQYLKADGAERVGLLKSLAINFGEHEDKAMIELAANGLPFTAQFSSFFSDPDKTEKFLSFDEKGEQEILKQFLKDNDINFQDLRENIFDNIEDFNDAVMFANQFDTSIAADKLDSLMDLLAYYTANEMRAGKKQSVALKNASNLINENFDIHETYFVPRIYDGESLTGGQVDFVTEKAEKIQEDYLELFGAVSFKSKDETDVTILDETMKKQLMKNGKWVNKADGSGLIYGIVFPDNSFAPVYNESGDALEFDFNDDSFTLPGTDIEMNFDKINIIPDDQAKLIDEENKILLASADKNFKFSMKKSESDGNYMVVNSEGYMGAYQFGNARLTDYKNATGKNFTKKEFLENEELQDEVFNWHTKDIVTYVNNKGLDTYIGKEINGVLVTLNGLVAVAHLGGKSGMAKFLKTNGKYNPADSNGTTLTDYLNKFKLTE